VTTTKTLGVVSSVMGTGMLFGSVFAARLIKNRGGFTRMLGYDAMIAAAMLGVGLGTSPLMIGAMGFLFLFGLAGMLAEEQALWQVRIPVEAQGRVFALRRLITFASLPLSYGIAGPLADRVFEPLVRTGVYQGSFLAEMMGSGRGRGMALLVFCGGLIKVAIVVAGARNRELRKLDALE